MPNVAFFGVKPTESSQRRVPSHTVPLAISPSVYCSNPSDEGGVANPEHGDGSPVMRVRAEQVRPDEHPLDAPARFEDAENPDPGRLRRAPEPHERHEGDERPELDGQDGDEHTQRNDHEGAPRTVLPFMQTGECQGGDTANPGGRSGQRALTGEGVEGCGGSTHGRRLLGRWTRWVVHPKRERLKLQRDAIQPHWHADVANATERSPEREKPHMP